MRSQKQSATSRANGAKSTGPKTPETKSISASNSLKHGFNSKTIVLQNENPLAWEAHLEAYLAKFQPQSKPEHDLVVDMAAAQWRLRRLLKIETATLDIAMDRQAAALSKEFEILDEPVRMACAFQKLADESRGLSLLNRYEVRLRKAYESALASLIEIRKMSSPPNSSPNEPEPLEVPDKKRSIHLVESTPQTRPQPPDTPISA